MAINQILPVMPVHVMKLKNPVGSFHKIKVYNLFYQVLKDKRIAVFEQEYHGNGYHVFKNIEEIGDFFEPASNQLDHSNAA